MLKCTDISAALRMHLIHLQIPRYISTSLQAGNRWEENGKYGEEVLINVFTESEAGAQVLLQHRHCNDNLSLLY